MPRDCGARKDIAAVDTVRDVQWYFRPGFRFFPSQDSVSRLVRLRAANKTHVTEDRFEKFREWTDLFSTCRTSFD